MAKPGHEILLYYKYVKIENPVGFMRKHRRLCESLGLTGRIIVAEEGINGTVEGLKENTEKYIKSLTSDKRFADIHFKKSMGTGNAFPKLWIRVREEIVASYLLKTEKPVNPLEVTGKYVTPEQLHKWINSNKQSLSANKKFYSEHSGDQKFLNPKPKSFYLVDMRNDYETEVGYFENSIKAPFKNFRDLAKVLPTLESLKNETIVTVCTGGVRCEKASGFLVAHGFSDVYQLYGGIVSYMEKYPNEDFLGKLYVFDGRITIGFNVKDAKHKVVGKCAVCNSPADTYRDCANLACSHKRHFVACDECHQKQLGYCSTCSEVLPSKCSVSPS